jgi:hypothetical protein
MRDNVKLREQVTMQICKWYCIVDFVIYIYSVKP